MPKPATPKPKPGPSKTDAAASELPVYRLYVSSASPVSARAIVNARKFFEQHLPGQVLTVLDIAVDIEQARADQVFASPTLVRVSPLPQRRLIGDLSNTERLRQSLGVVARPLDRPLDPSE